MQKFVYQITDGAGIHIRPAGELVELAKTFACDVQIEAGGRSASLKKLFALMALAIGQGDEVTVSAEGQDEQQAITAIQNFFTNNL